MTMSTKVSDNILSGNDSREFMVQRTVRSEPFSKRLGKGCDTTGLVVSELNAY